MLSCVLQFIEFAINLEILLKMFLFNFYPMDLDPDPNGAGHRPGSGSAFSCMRIGNTEVKTLLNN